MNLLKMKLRVALLVFAAIAAGCASGPKFSDVKNTIPGLRPENGRIFFYRPSALGAAIQPNILLNGTVVGEMVPHGFFFIDRAPGNYLVSAKTEAEATLQLTLLANQTQYVKGGITFGIFVGRPDLTLVDTTTALMDLQDLAYIGSVRLGAGVAESPTPTSSGVAGQPPSPPAGEAVKLKDLEGLLQKPSTEKQ